MADNIINLPSVSPVEDSLGKIVKNTEDAVKFNDDIFRPFTENLMAKMSSIYDAITTGMDHIIDSLSELPDLLVTETKTEVVPALADVVSEPIVPTGADRARAEEAQQDQDKKMIELFKKLGSGLGRFAKENPLTELIVSWVKRISTLLGGTMKLVLSAILAFAGLDVLKEWLQDENNIKKVGEFAGKLVEIGEDIYRIATSLLTGEWAAAWEYIKELFGVDLPGLTDNLWLLGTAIGGIILALGVTGAGASIPLVIAITAITGAIVGIVAVIKEAQGLMDDWKGLEQARIKLLQIESNALKEQNKQNSLKLAETQQAVIAGAITQKEANKITAGINAAQAFTRAETTANENLDTTSSVVMKAPKVMRVAYGILIEKMKADGSFETHYPAIERKADRTPSLIIKKRVWGPDAIDPEMTKSLVPEAIAQAETLRSNMVAGQTLRDTVEAKLGYDIYSAYDVSPEQIQRNLSTNTQTADVAGRVVREQAMRSVAETAATQVNVVNTRGGDVINVGGGANSQPIMPTFINGYPVSMQSPLQGTK